MLATEDVHLSATGPEMNSYHHRLTVILGDSPCVIDSSGPQDVRTWSRRVRVPPPSPVSR